MVECDRFVYYQEGDPRKSVVPDVFVVLGLPGHVRRSYKVWEEGRPPDFVMEVASPGTVKADEEVKPGIYEGMGVREYFQFDSEPAPGLLDERLKARRLRDGVYETVRPERPAGMAASIRSEVLGLDFVWDGSQLRLWDPFNGRFLSVQAAVERAAAAEEEAAAARSEAAAARAVAEGKERENRELLARIAALEAQSGRSTP